MTENQIIAEKDGSLTVNVNGGEVAVNKDFTDESFDRTASHMAGEYVSYPAKTLTDEEIMDLWVKHLVDDIHVFARAVLKKANEK